MVAPSGRRWVFVLWAIVVVGAGCGSGPNYNDAIGRSQPPGTELPPVQFTPRLTTAPPTADPLPSTGAGRTTAPAAFCRDVNDVQALITTLLRPDGGTAAVNQARALLARMQADAPAELRPAIRTLSKIEERLIRDLSANPPDFSDLTTALADPAYQQALQQVIEYAAAHCSVNLTPPTT